MSVPVANHRTMRVVAERRVASEIPAILPVPAPHAHLHLAPDALGEAAQGCPHDGHVVRVEDARPHVVLRGDLLEAQSGVFEGGPVRVEDAALRVEDDEMMRNEVDDHAELALVLADALLRLLAVVDVGPRPVPADDASLVVVQRVHADEEPAVRAVLSEDAGLHLERRSL
jgi:hypothetical protein